MIRFGTYLVILGICLAQHSDASARPMQVDKPETPKIQLELDETKFALQNDHSQRKCWIGLCCRPISPIIKSQMDLDYGLAVLEIAEESPAYKAGIREYDIILEINRTKMRCGEQMSDLVDRMGERRIDVKLLRGGDIFNVAVMLELRPRCCKEQVVVVVDEHGNIDHEQTRKKIEEKLASSGKKPEDVILDLIVINPAILYPVPIEPTVEVVNSGINRQVNSKVMKFWNNEDAKGIEIIRLDADVQYQLESIVSLQTQLFAESMKINRLIDSIYREQTELKRKTAELMKQLKISYRDETLIQARQQLNEAENSLMRWNQLLEELECYRKALGNSCSKGCGK